MFVMANKEISDFSSERVGALSTKNFNLLQIIYHAPVFRISALNERHMTYGISSSFAVFQRFIRPGLDWTA